MNGVPDTIDVLARLALDLGERGPIRLSFEDPYQLPVDVEAVVAPSVALLMNELMKRNPLTGIQVGFGPVLTVARAARRCRCP